SLSDGNGGNNYTLTLASARGTILSRALHVTALASDRVYDGTTDASISLVDDRIAGDTLTVSYSSADFDDKNVGTGKGVQVSGISITGGADVGNYLLVAATASAVATISPRPLAISAVTDTKTYDGTTASSGVPQITNGSLAAGDSIASLSQTFDDRDAGTSHSLIPLVSLSDGNSGDNYTLTLVGASGTILPRSLHVTAS